MISLIHQQATRKVGVMFTKGQEVKVTVDTLGFSDLEVSAPFYGRVEHVYADDTVQVAYLMFDRSEFTDHAIVSLEDVEAV